MPRGRPAGSRGKKTLAREAVKQAIERQIDRHAAALIHAQLNLALGSFVLFRRSGKPPERVRDKKEIEQYMAGTLDKSLYTEIMADRPNGAMISDLLNRRFGTPKQTIEMPDHPYRPLFALPGGEGPDLS